ncbi:MAG: ATP-binding cassette domain-containing protein [Acidimicrobiia bacterium]|nr:ATP-binding cassette domain-containing protein [Acidimicrobiia bacterium]
MTVPGGPASAGGPAVRCRSLGVSFGAVRALHGVSLDLAPGRIHALVGQNGAGKTTLAKVLGGLQAPDAGDVHIAGRKLPSGDVRAARAAGLAMVHQHFSLPPSFTVAEALELTAARPGGRSVYRRAELHQRWQDDVAEIGGEAVLSTRIRDLPVETRQSLEIMRALATEARVLVLDEPTALLAPAAIDALFERLRRLRDGGVTVLVVLHKLREVAAVADTVSVLRDGELALGPIEMSEVSQGRLSDAIVGPASQADRAVGVEAATGTERRTLLELVRVSSRESAFEPGLRDVDLRVEAGEIVGIAGVEGNGQRSLVSVIAGLDVAAEGTVLIGGADATRAPPAGRRLRGLRLVPFDRNSEGISRRAPLWLNQSALRLVERRRRRLPLISLRQYKQQAAMEMDQWRVRYDAVTQPAESLSGGNVQRLILSRELAPGLEVLVAAQPTRGLDFAATDFVRRSLRGLRDAGAGVLLVSSDLDELFENSDRLHVMYGGRIVARFEAPYDRRAVGDAMTGARR